MISDNFINVTLRSKLMTGAIFVVTEKSNYLIIASCEMSQWIKYSVNLIKFYMLIISNHVPTFDTVYFQLHFKYRRLLDLRW